LSPKGEANFPNIDWGNSYIFDIAQLNSNLTTNLSDNFNYIGWACGFIVFFFLWFSLGSIELALLSFLPMAISWVWILGLMGLLGIQFNIVNVILATFIFGQGDDYTIFMTEGASYEYAYRRKMLSSYKHSIILSALIMFIGIGSLVFAHHPALKSLAEVTIVGMFSVVLMAYIFPPLIFRWLVWTKGTYRDRPLSFQQLAWNPIRQRLWKTSEQDELVSLVIDRYRYKGVEVTNEVAKCLKKRSINFVSKTDDSKKITIQNEGYGEGTLLFALQHPEVEITVEESDEDKIALLKYSAEGIAPNLKINQRKKNK